MKNVFLTMLMLCLVSIANANFVDDGDFESGAMNWPNGWGAGSNGTFVGGAGVGGSIGGQTIADGQYWHGFLDLADAGGNWGSADYTLTLQAKADVAGTVIEFGWNGPGYANWSGHITLTTDWEIYSVTAPFPVAGQAANGDVFIYQRSAGGMTVDNVSFALYVDETSTAACCPDPGVGDEVDSSLTTLSWTNPDPNDPNEPGVVTATAYLLESDVALTEDPNLGPIVFEAGVQALSVDTPDYESADITGLLAGDKYYYWAVHCTDPNGGSPVTTQGEVWNFQTSSDPQPVDNYVNDGDFESGVQSWPDGWGAGTSGVFVAGAGVDGSIGGQTTLNGQYWHGLLDVADAGGDWGAGNYTMTIQAKADVAGTMFEFGFIGPGYANWSGFITLTTDWATYSVTAPFPVAGQTASSDVFIYQRSDGGMTIDNVSFAATAGEPPSSASAGDIQYLWLDAGTKQFTLTGTYTDDGSSPVTVAWSDISNPADQAPGTTVTINSPTSATTTVDVDGTGWFTFRFTATNDSGSASDDVNIGVYVDACEAAKADPSDFNATYPDGLHGDIDGDCDTDIVDFAALASTWLDCMSLKLGC